jgi:hypothetical protein
LSSSSPLELGKAQLPQPFAHAARAIELVSQWCIGPVAFTIRLRLAFILSNAFTFSIVVKQANLILTIGHTLTNVANCISERIGLIHALRGWEVGTVAVVTANCCHGRKEREDARRKALVSHRESGFRPADQSVHNVITRFVEERSRDAIALKMEPAILVFPKISAERQGKRLTGSGANKESSDGRTEVFNLESGHDWRVVVSGVGAGWAPAGRGVGQAA